MKKKSRKLVIAIDGHSSTGKSSFAKSLAKELGILYVDSGAMYRAVTLWAIRNAAAKDNFVDTEKIIEGLNKIDIRFKKVPGSEEPHLFLNDVDCEDEIRSMEVSKLVSPVSKIGEVRSKMVDLQRKMAEKNGVIMDGRDIGTVVFPAADIKIFMTADAKIRAQRRYEELKEKGKDPVYEEVLDNINERDHIDQTRDISPLKKAEDAVVLDNSKMTPREQMEWFYEKFEDIIR